MVDGCLVVYKPKGITSHDVINKIRRVYKLKKCGHAGTLDPMAQGVVLVFFGKALKLINLIPTAHLDKTYLARIALGLKTDSYDATGKITEIFDGAIDYPTPVINEVINSFVGKYDQIPPIYSAIKVNGRKAYSMARAGEEVKLEGRPVEVNSIRLLDKPKIDDRQSLLLRVHCSRGTYIRSLAYDIGEKLGCGAHLSYLLRERVGKWDFSQAFPYWKLEKGIAFEDSPAFTSFSNILSFPRIIVKPEAIFKINNGQALSKNDIYRLETTNDEYSEIFQVFSPNNRLTAVYTANKNGKRQEKDKNDSRLFPMKVFHEDETD